MKTKSNETVAVRISRKLRPQYGPAKVDWWYATVGSGVIIDDSGPIYINQRTGRYYRESRRNFDSWLARWAGKRISVAEALNRARFRPQHPKGGEWVRKHQGGAA